MASRMLKKDLDSLAGKYNFALDSIAKKFSVNTDEMRAKKLVAQYTYTRQAYEELKSLQIIQKDFR